jgi:hypothetical protein
MLRAQGLIPDRQGALQEGFGCGIAALGLVEHSEIIEDHGHIGMLGAEPLLLDRQGAL